MTAQQGWWILAITLPTIMALAGFLFGLDTKDTREDNLTMGLSFALLSTLATIWTLDPLLPDWSKWWTLLIAPAWFGYLIWWGLIGFIAQRRRSKIRFEVEA